MGGKELSKSLGKKIAQMARRYIPSLMVVLSSFSLKANAEANYDTDDSNLINKEHQTTNKTGVDVLSISEAQNKNMAIRSASNEAGNSMVSIVDQLNKRKDVLQQELDSLRNQLETISSDEYAILGRKIKMNYENINPVSVPHFYESGLNPAQVGGGNQYLGLYQFNLNTTINPLVKDLSDEFPELAEAARRFGVKSNKFKEVWKNLSFGDKSERFEERQFKFMWDNFYQKSFDKLSRELGLPEITLDNYRDAAYRAYVIAVCSLGIQSPSSTCSVISKACNKVVAEQKTNTPDPNAVGIASYDIRATMWKSFAGRYLGKKGTVGEKTMVSRIVDYNNKAPELKSQIEAAEKALKRIDLLIESHVNQSFEIDDYLAVQSREMISKSIEKIPPVELINREELNKVKKLVNNNKQYSSKTEKVVASVKQKDIQDVFAQNKGRQS